MISKGERKHLVKLTEAEANKQRRLRAIFNINHWMKY